MCGLRVVSHAGVVASPSTCRCSQAASLHHRTRGRRCLLTGDGNLLAASEELLLDRFFCLVLIVEPLTALVHAAVCVGSSLSGFANCVVIDMASASFRTSARWDPRTGTCICPNGFRACAADMVDTQTHWREHILTEDGVCKGVQEPIVAVAQDGQRSLGDLCTLASEKKGGQISWQNAPSPAYEDQDLIVGDAVVRSGNYLCEETWRYVFCPGEALVHSARSFALVKGAVLRSRNRTLPFPNYFSRQSFVMAASEARV